MTNKSEIAPFRVERFTKEHDVSEFSSSNNELTRYLLEDALKDQSKRTSVTHLLSIGSGEIVGYFTLSTDSLKVDSIGPGITFQSYPYSSIPALKIARLSTNRGYERKGLGTKMVDLSFRYLFEVTRYAGCRVMTVDSKKGSEGFYEKCGFRKTRITRGDTVPMYLDIRPFIEGMGNCPSMAGSDKHSSRCDGL